MLIAFTSCPANGYDADRAEERLKASGLKPRREGNRVYFPDLDGIQVQVAGK